MDSQLVCTFFLGGPGFELRVYVLLELVPPQQPFLCDGFFSRYGLVNYASGLASYCDPPHLCLLRSQDYRCEPLIFSLHAVSKKFSEINESEAVRYCQIKTTPRVEKKDLLEPDCRAVTLGFRVKQLG
jgi:hypothetical protein